jgi:hypothetical protein
MSEKPGKYAAALAGLHEPMLSQHITLPPKPEPPKGKRSREGWRQKQVLLNAASVDHANARLRNRGDKTDFSDLMQALLDAWLATPE